MKKAAVIGASSGIGRELAKQLSESGVTVGLAARREELLKKLQNELPNPSYIKKLM
ncbi:MULTISPECIES: SDR family NAD(P)-dependent oxidoreductase [Bacillus]|uniref:SDR family NAD(P)-dependent oxidoreductase n=1 Tax=Bacillus TaxID=1386 RepID=UPI0008153A7F|nr:MULTISPECIES: SDR family NAD(P)-dependent oxidoreductase [Bacillus]MDU0070088.1 SDR family NAD(P)-dependent oxidoreductase [Bacillus sp. IG6]MED8017761.1 SDR family NAD(P)-dependent oxidoreductase [Bacillus glycinifermentans]WKB76145.1 SDR family NAD(P)-dependent oxidoreductase [Bacillus glycinifermentans]SCA87198.1 short-chain dehydrogenase/reductase SDR [Bacillus glycinifermentans]